MSAHLPPGGAPYWGPAGVQDSQYPLDPTNGANPPPSIRGLNRTLLGDQGIAQMTPEQALRLYLQNRGVTPERTELLVKYYRQMDNAHEEC